MGFFSRRKHRQQAYEFGRQTAEVMLNSASAVILDAGGVDKIKPGDICRKVLSFRPEWEVSADGKIEFAGQSVSEWLEHRPGIPTMIDDKTSVGNLTPMIIACEYTRLLTLEEGRNDLILTAFDGCHAFFRSQGLIIHD